MKRPNPDSTAPVIVTKAYDFVKWLLPKVERFPRTHKFTLGDRLSALGLDLLTVLVEAAYDSDKSASLREASRRVNSVRYLLRLSKDLQLISTDS